MKRKVEIEVDVPEDGYDVLGWRHPLKGQSIIDVTGQCVLIADRDYSEPRWVLRKVEPVRESRYGWFTDGGVCTLEEFRRFYPTARAVRMDLEDGKPVRVALDPAPPLTP